MTKPRRYYYLRGPPTISLIKFKHIEAESSGRYFPHDKFKCIFLNKDIWILIKISLKFVPKRPFNNESALGLEIAQCRRTGDKALSETILSSLTHIWGARGRWVNIDSLLAIFYMVYWHANIYGFWINLTLWTVRIFLKILRARFQASQILSLKAYTMRIAVYA